MSAIPRLSTNHRGIKPIITEGCPRMIGYLPMHSSVDIGLRICTGRDALDSPVRCEVIAYSYLTSSANIDIVPAIGPLATDI